MQAVIGQLLCLIILHKHGFVLEALCSLYNLIQTLDWVLEKFESTYVNSCLWLGFT